MIDAILVIIDASDVKVLRAFSVRFWRSCALISLEIIQNIATNILYANVFMYIFTGISNNTIQNTVVHNT